MRVRILMIALVSSLVLAGCGSSTATVGKSWVDKDLGKKNLSGVLVVAMATSEEGRRSFEREFTDALKKQDVHAIASYELKGGTDIEKEDVVAMADQAGVDTVLVTLFAGRDNSEVLHRGRSYYAYAPVYGHDVYGRGRVYGVPYKVGQSSDFWAQHNSIHLEANLYEIKTEELLWRASSGMTEEDDISTMRSAFIKSFMKDLAEKNMVD